MIQFANMKVSKRMQTIPVSSVRRLSPYAAAAKKKGASIYHLNIGDPDVETPQVMIDVLRNWNTNPIGYAPSPGYEPFVSALVSYYGTHGHSFLVPEDMVTTVGGSEALLMAMFGTTEPGDEILVFEPFYSNYSSIAQLTDTTLRAVPTSLENGFHLPDKDTITAAITPKTKAILFCSPGNPTGTVYSKEETDMLVAIAKEHGLFLISDEVYREYVFTGSPPPTSLLSYMQELPEQIIVLDSLSKRYSLCGARLGVFISRNAELISGAVKIAQSRLSSGLIDQAVGAALTDVPDAYIAQVQREYEQRRDTLYEGLTAIPGVSMAKPEGAFYTMVSLPVEDAEQFAIWLLEEYRTKDNETVMLAPGSGFYLTPGRGKNEVRIAYILNSEKLKKCITIISEALDKYRS